MGGVGSCFDNAAVESWHSTLEFELLSRRRFSTKAEARREVARFIDRYNATRRHSACAMRSPVDYEQILASESHRRGRGRVKLVLRETQLHADAVAGISVRRDDMLNRP